MKLLPLKLRTYETVHHLNRGFELVLMNLERLRNFGFRREFLNHFRDMAEELRAETNHELMETLHQRELEDWTRFGRRNHRREKRLRDPNDALLEAKRIRFQQRQRKQQRKPQKKLKPTTPRKLLRA